MSVRLTKVTFDLCVYISINANIDGDVTKFEKIFKNVIA